MSGSFRDGVYLVELETVNDASLVVSAALSALGARDYPDLTPTASLTQYLRAREVLVILDNCEHVVGEVAKLAAGVLRYCPRTRILATSREPLLTAGEVTFAVPPLGRPGPGHLPPLDELGRLDSVRLFVERACAVDPAFHLDDENAPAVAEICSRLDGMPMAIELAAARARGITPPQIAERLSDRFRLLTGGSRTSVPRQQTLRATCDWSHELLSGAERAAWRRLSVFPAGCSLKGAEAVAGFGEVEVDEVVDLVDQLVARSVLSRTGGGGDARYHMLETLRAYGLPVSSKQVRRKRPRYACGASPSRWPKRAFRTGWNASARPRVAHLQRRPGRRRRVRDAASSRGRSRCPRRPSHGAAPWGGPRRVRSCQRAPPGHGGDPAVHHRDARRRRARGPLFHPLRDRVGLPRCGPAGPRPRGARGAPPPPRAGHRRSLVPVTPAPAPACGWRVRSNASV